MGIQVGDNFDHKSKKPLDNRITYATLALMKAVTDANIYEGCEAYCAETDKYYMFKSTNTVDADTGKWRERAGGGHEIEDEDGTALTQREVMQFTDSFDVSDDSTNEKTVVDLKSLDTGDMDTIVYPLPTEYHPDTKCGYTPVGTIIAYFGNTPPLHYLACDGSGYMAADYPELAQYMWDNFPTSAYSGDGTTTFAVPDLRGEFLRGTGTNSHAKNGNGASVGVHQDSTLAPIMRGSTAYTDIVVGDGSGDQSFVSNQDGIYKNVAGSTKWTRVAKSSEASTGLAGEVYSSRPTNTSVLWCIATKDIYIDARYDYSTNEKVIGSDTDGSPIYQKTFFAEKSDFSGQEGHIAHDIVNLKSVISFEGIATDSTSAHLQRPLCFSYTSATDTSAVSWYAGVYVDVTNIVLQMGSAFYNNLQSIRITMRYTKTTS